MKFSQTITATTDHTFAPPRAPKIKKVREKKSTTLTPLQELRKYAYRQHDDALKNPFRALVGEFCFWDKVIKIAPELSSELVDDLESNVAMIVSVVSFMQDQNMTIAEFCEHYDDNMVLARLTQ